MTDVEKKEYKKEYDKKYNIQNKEKKREKRKKYLLENKEKLKEKKKIYYINNKEKVKEKSKIHYQNNKEEKIKYTKEYRENNKEQRNKYLKNKRDKNPLFKLRCNIRNRILKSIKNNSYSKKSRTFEILGCSYEDFKQHLERQFTKGMTWQNQGEWHLDHIYPVSLAKDEQELIKLNHYTNFQPMWALENTIKGNKIIPNTQIKLI